MDILWLMVLEKIFSNFTDTRIRHFFMRSVGNQNRMFFNFQIIGLHVDLCADIYALLGHFYTIYSKPRAIGSGRVV